MKKSRKDRETTGTTGTFQGGAQDGLIDINSPGTARRVQMDSRTHRSPLIWAAANDRPEIVAELVQVRGSGANHMRVVCVLVYVCVWLPIYSIILLISPITPWWEIFNVVIKVTMVAGTELMYEDSRKITYIVAISVSLALHILVQPYKDNAGNIMVVAFCVIDLIAIHADQNLILQIVVFSMTLLALLIIWFLCIRSSLASAKERKRKGVKNTEEDFNFLEKVVLCPLLALMWPMKQLMKLTSSSSNTTRILPVTMPRRTVLREASTIEEKTKELDKLRIEIERQRSQHEEWDSSSEDENGARSF